MTNGEFLKKATAEEMSALLDSHKSWCVGCRSDECRECWNGWLKQKHDDGFEHRRECPFCGNRAIILFDVGDDPTSYYMGCHICGARTARFFTREEAETAWNRRKKDDK